MFTINPEPKTKINQPSRNLNWVVQPAPQAYTFDEVNGDLTEEITSAAVCSKIEMDLIPSIEPEDFEAAYQWFIS